MFLPPGVVLLIFLPVLLYWESLTTSHAVLPVQQRAWSPVLYRSEARHPDRPTVRSGTPDTTDDLRCSYDHGPVELGLTDHAALVLVLGPPAEAA